MALITLHRNERITCTVQMSEVCDNGDPAKMATQRDYWTNAEKRTWSLVLFLGMVALYTNRMALPFTIVEMGEELGWNKKDCGVILSAFYWGYILPQVVGGWISDRYGGARVLWISGLMWSLSGLSIAYLAHVSTLAIFSARFIAGLAQGAHYPAVVSLLTKKVDQKERSFYYGLINSGTPVGPVILGALGSLLLSAQDWPLVYISCGVLGVFSALLLRFVSWEPTLGAQASVETSRETGGAKFRDFLSAIPWKGILTHKAVLVVFFVHFCENFLIHNLLSWLPTYYHDTFPSKASSGWVYNSLPWVTMALGCYVGAWLGHQLGHTCGLGMTSVRKIIIFIGLGGQSICLFLMAGVAQQDTTSNFFVVSSLLAVANLANGILCVGPTMCLADLVPDHSGVLYGVMNSVSALPGIFGVSITGYILHVSSSWSLVFVIMATINLPSLAAFMVYGSSTRIHLDSS